MTRSLRLRLSIIGVAALVASLIAIQPGHSQFPGRPGGPPGFPSRPPGIPSGIPGGIAGRPGISGISGAGGMPGGIPGPPPGFSGFTGISGIGGMSGRPGFSGISGISGAGGMAGGMGRPPGIGDVGRTVTEWYCSGCRKVLGTGPVPPLVTTCPGCGVRLSGVSLMPDMSDPRRPSSPPPPTVPPPTVGVPAVAPPTVPPPAVGLTTPPRPSYPAEPSSTSQPTPPQPPSDSKFTRGVVLFIVIFAVVLLVCSVIIYLGVKFVNSQMKTAPKSQKRFRERHTWLDDDEEDRPRKRKPRRDFED